MNKFIKKAFSASVAVTTIMWSLGLAAFPLVSSAQVQINAGDLVKKVGVSEVFYYGSDAKLHPFPNQFVFNTWYADFSGVKEISQAQMDTMTFGKNIVQRPGTRLVKIQAASPVYCVEAGGVLKHVDSEARAVTLFGADWNKQIDDVPTAFWSDYTISGAINSDVPCDGSVVTMASASAEAGKNYWVEGGMLHEISAAQMAEARLWAKYVRSLDSAVINALSVGSAVDQAKLDMIKDSAQTGSVSTPAPAGDLTITKASSSPSAMSVPYKAKWVPFLDLMLQGTGTLGNLTVTRSGLSANADIANVYVLDENGQQIKLGKTIGSDNKAKFTGLGIAVNGSRKITIAADIAASGTATAGNKVILGVESATDVGLSAAAISGSFPMRSAQMEISSVTIGEATLYNGPSNPTSDVEISPNATNYLLTQLRVTAGSAEAVNFDEVTLHVNGTGDLDDIKQVVMKDDTSGTILGTATVAQLTPLVGSTSITFYPNVSIAKGESRNFGWYVDMAGTGSSRTIALEPHDGVTYTMKFKGQTYGFNVPTTRSNFCNSNGTCQTQTIQQGQHSMSKSPNTLATGNFAPGANDQEIATFRNTVTGEPIEVTNSIFALTYGTMVNSEVTNVTLRMKPIASQDEGVIVAGPVDPSAGTVTFSDSFTLPVGDSDLILSANFATTVSNNDTISANINTPATKLTMRGSDSGKTITSGTSSQVTGNTLTVQAPTVTVNTAATPVADNVVVGKQGHLLADIDVTVQNGAVNMTKLTVADALGGGAALADIAGLKMWGPESIVNAASVDAAQAPAVGYVQMTTSNSTDTNAATVSFNFNKTYKLPVGTHRFKLTGNVIADADGGGSGTHTYDAAAAGSNHTFTDPNTSTDISESVAGSGQAQTIKTSGTLAVTAASTTPEPRIVSSNTANASATIYKLAAGDEAIDLTDFVIYAAGADKDTALASNNSIGMVKIEKSTVAAAGIEAAAWETVGAAGGYAIGNDDTLTVNLNSGDLRVPEDDDLWVKLSFNTPEKNSITNNTTLILGLADSNSDGSEWGGAGNYNITAVGVDSGASLTKANIDSIGDGNGNTALPSQHRIFRAKLQLSRNAASPSGKQSPSSNLLVGKYNFTAVGGTVYINELEMIAQGTADLSISGGATGVTRLEESGVSVLGANLQCKDGAGNGNDNVTCLDPTSQGSDGHGPADFSFGDAETDANDNNEAFAVAPLEVNGTRVLDLKGDVTGVSTDKTLSVCIGPSSSTASGVEWESEGPEVEFDNTITEGSNLETCSNTITF